jgi:hypothetical protein
MKTTRQINSLDIMRYVVAGIGAVGIVIAIIITQIA